MRMLSFARRHPRIGLLIVVTIAVASWVLLRAPHPATESMSLVAAGSEAPKPAGPPWLYGRADARFTVVGYADLECPYCRAYFPALKRWIDAHPEVNWQWHHLPLSMHEPAATAGARLAECAGETGGHATFW
ncbi:thioredoxin domain-containing protein, partial [Pseudomonas aeruginosa]|nr:thioredoxin domain-containing protein [Pseudomonas aeruginosa]MDG4292183.1 thioredoxin domain-containing protein [Pseudomonas aeruginosa]MDG4343368.1 thioredoxin domain-containing protein [Pseudomonas aeruginosa]